MTTEFIVVVVYDISNNKLRNYVEKTCKRYGLHHIQRSAFVGLMEESLRRELYVELLNIVEQYGSEGDVCIRIYRIRISDYRHTLKIGELHGFDPDPEPWGVFIA